MLPNDVRAHGNTGGDARAPELGGVSGDGESWMSDSDVEPGKSAWRDAWRAVLPTPCVFMCIVRRRSEPTDG